MTVNIHLVSARSVVWFVEPQTITEFLCQSHWVQSWIWNCASSENLPTGHSIRPLHRI